MKKFLSSIIALFAGVFAFIGFIMPAIGYRIIVGNSVSNTYTSGYDFILFEENLPTVRVMFNIFAIALLVVAALLVVVSIIRFFADNKKFKLEMIQNILACVLAILAIAVLICVIADVSDLNNSMLITDHNFYLTGVGPIVNCIVLVICAILTFLFNCGKKKKK